MSEQFMVRKTKQLNDRIGRILILLSAFSITTSCDVENNKQSPNIVFIMSDDHAYQAISAYGHGLNNTPNIDRIANEGATFLKGFVSNSICAPSLATMFIGKHSFKHGKIDNIQPYDWYQPNFPKLLQQAGYQNGTHWKNPPGRASPVTDIINIWILENRKT